MKEKGITLGFKSAFYPQGALGYIYIEADREDAVAQVVSGLDNFFLTKPIPLPLPDMPNVLRAAEALALQKIDTIAHLQDRKSVV